MMLNDEAGAKAPGLRCTSFLTRCLQGPALGRSYRDVMQLRSPPNDEAAALAAACWQRARDQALSLSLRSPPTSSMKSMTPSTARLRQCSWSLDTVQTRSPTQFLPIRDSDAAPSLSSPQPVFSAPVAATTSAESDAHSARLRSDARPARQLFSRSRVLILP